MLIIFVLTLTMTLSVSSLGKKTQTQRRSCMVLLLWKFSLFIFVWLGQAGPSACNRGSGPTDDLPPPPQAPTPPPVLQLQPSTDTPAPTGSAGQTVLTRQSMGTRAAVSHCGDASEKQLIILLCMTFVFCCILKWLTGKLGICLKI